MHVKSGIDQRFGQTVSPKANPCQTFHTMLENILLLVLILDNLNPYCRAQDFYSLCRLSITDFFHHFIAPIN